MSESLLQASTILQDRIIWNYYRGTDYQRCWAPTAPVILNCAALKGRRYVSMCTTQDMIQSDVTAQLTRHPSQSMSRTAFQGHLTWLPTMPGSLPALLKQIISTRGCSMDALGHRTASHSHLHTAIVNYHGVEFDLGIQFCHLFTALEEESISQLPEEREQHSF